MDIHSSEAEKRVLALISQYTGQIVNYIDYQNSMIQQKNQIIEDASEKYLELEKKMVLKTREVENIQKLLSEANAQISTLERIIGEEAELKD